MGKSSDSILFEYDATNSVATFLKNKDNRRFWPVDMKGNVDDRPDAVEGIEGATED